MPDKKRGVALIISIVLILLGGFLYFYAANLAGLYMTRCDSFALDAAEEKCREPVYWAFGAIFVFLIGICIPLFLVLKLFIEKLKN